MRSGGFASEKLHFKRVHNKKNYEIRSDFSTGNSDTTFLAHMNARIGSTRNEII